MKAVLVSIKPKWCELIADGKKTIEVRKTAPNLDLPFKSYIYETLGVIGAPWMDEEGHLVFKGRGQVVGEFKCKEITPIDVPYPAYWDDIPAEIYKASCLTYSDLHSYGGSNSRLYGWNISDLRMYDKPRPITMFMRPCDTEEPCALCKYAEIAADDMLVCEKRVMRAPQSWMYVEEIVNEADD